MSHYPCLKKIASEELMIDSASDYTSFLYIGARVAINCFRGFASPRLYLSHSDVAFL